jgi:hypothetical protein
MAPPPLLGESFDDIIALRDRRCLAPPPLPPLLLLLVEEHNDKDFCNCCSDEEDDDAPVEDDVMENDSLATVVLDVVRYESSKLLLQLIRCLDDRRRFLT